MKGRIGVESEGEGKGSTFWFTIPYKPKEAPTLVITDGEHMTKYVNTSNIKKYVDEGL